MGKFLLWLQERIKHGKKTPVLATWLIRPGLSGKEDYHAILPT